MAMTAEDHPSGRRESFPCDGPADVDVRIAGGRITIRPGNTPQATVEVHRLDDSGPEAAPALELRAEDAISPSNAGEEEPAVRDVRVSFSPRTRKLIVHSPRQRLLSSGPLDVVVCVPQGSRVTAHASYGSIAAAEGVLDRLQVSVRRGDIAVERVEGDANVRTGSGDISVGRVSGRLTSATGAGNVEVASLAGEFAKVATGRGDIALGVVETNLVARTGRGGLTVAEAVGGDLALTTGAGNIRVGVLPGAAAQIDLVSGSGDAHSDLPVTDRAPEGPRMRIRARTGFGDVLVTSASA